MSRQKKGKIASFFLLLQVIFSLVLPLQPLANIAFAQEVKSVEFVKNGPSITVNNSQATNFKYFFQTSDNVLHAGEGVALSNILNLDLKSQSATDSVVFNVDRLVLKTDSNSYYLEIAENTVSKVKEYQSDSLEITAQEQNFLVNSWKSDAQNHLATTSADVVLNQEYVFPLNGEVKVTFTKLPEKTSPLSIQEIQLSAEQQKTLGTASSIAYDVTTTMKDGEFAFDLQLPSVSNKENVSVKFAENVAGLNSAATVNNEVSNDGNQVTVKNLDHMTIFVVVYPLIMATNIVDVQANSNSWFFYNDENDTIDNSLGSFVTGPATPPNGTGSVQISVSGTQRRNLATYKFSGTVLSSITQLGFSTYNPSAGNIGNTNKTAYLNFNVDFDGSDTWQKRLIFTPPSNEVLQDTWQSWDAIKGGNALWHYSGTTWPITGEPGTTAKTWNQILSEYSGIRVRVTDSWMGIRVGSPYPDGYTENIDAFVFGTAAATTIYNFDPNPYIPECNASNSFDSSNLGSVNGQDGWTVTGNYDQAIVNNIYGYSSFGCKSLRISDAITSGGFGDQVFAKPTTNGAGETSATSGSFSVGTKQNHFEAQFDIASATPNGETGTKLSISPDRGDGSRMSYLRFEDNMGGIDVFFDDALNGGPAFSPTNWHETKIASLLSSEVPHTIKFVMDFVDGEGNDVVEIYIDGNLVHTGTSWENYYRFDAEASAEQSPRIVKTLIFREGGDANSLNNGGGFLIDNVSLASSTIQSDTTAPTTPTLLSPADGVYRHTSDTNFSDWSDVTDPSGVGYRYQSAADIGFSSLYYDSNNYGPLLTESQIMNPGEPEVSYFWRVQACDLVGNCSAWSDPWKINIDNTAPITPTMSGFKNPNLSCGSITNIRTVTVDWSDSTDNISLAGYEYQIDYPTTNGGRGIWNTFFTNSEYRGTLNEGIHYVKVRAKDSAGNVSNWSESCSINYDSVAPTDPGSASSTPNPTNSLTQTWNWLTSTDLGSGVKGYYQQIYNNVTSSIFSGWTWIGNVLGSTTNLTDGQWQIQLKSEDNAGNQSNEVNSSTLVVDTIAPVVAITAPTTSIVSGIVQIKGTVTDANPHHYYLVIQNSSNAVVAGPGTVNRNTSFTDENLFNWNTNSLADGIYTIRLEARDAANNKDSGSVATKAVRVDHIAPVTTDDIADSNWHSSNVTVNLLCSDSGSLCDKTYYKINGGSFIEGTGFTLSDEGEYTISYYSVDKVGNSETVKTAIQTVKIDKTASIPTTKTEFSGWYNSDQTSTFNFTDSMSGIATGLPVTCSTSTEGTAQTCTVTPNVCDEAGNCYTSELTSNGADIDKTKPDSIITSPVNGESGSVIYTNAWNGLISGTSSDATSDVNKVYLSIEKTSDNTFWNGTTWIAGTESTVRVEATGTGTWTYNLPEQTEGTYKIVSHALDNANNLENSYELTIVFDKTIPEVALSVNPTTADGQNGWYVTRPTVSLTSTDDQLTDHIEYQWESKTGSWNTYVSSIQPSNEGNHVLYYRAIDKAGNESAIGAKNLNWDQTELTEGPLSVDATPDRSSGPNAKVTWKEAKDNVEINHYKVIFDLLNGDADFSEDVASHIREFTTDRLKEVGTWKVTVVAYDGAGHSKSASDEIIIENTAPAAGTVLGTNTFTRANQAPTVLGANTETPEQTEATEQAALTPVTENQKGAVLGDKTSTCSNLVNNSWWVLLLIQFFGLLIAEYKLGKKHKWLKVVLYALLTIAPVVLVYYFIKVDCFGNAATIWVLHHYYLATLAFAMLAKVLSYVIVQEDD